MNPAPYLVETQVTRSNNEIMTCLWFPLCITLTWIVVSRTERVLWQMCPYTAMECYAFTQLCDEICNIYIYIIFRQYKGFHWCLMLAVSFSIYRANSQIYHRFATLAMWRTHACISHPE